MSVTLITGGGRGIGRAIALAFAEPGATVAIAARTTAQLDRTAGEIRDRGGEAIALTIDVANAASVSRAVAELRERAAALDVLVNNAGIGGGQPVEGSDEQAWRRILDTNVAGTYLVSREALPLIPTGGRIVNMSSVLGRFGVPGYTAYCASKHAVIGFTRALALELAPRAITVNALCPGWVETDMAAEGMTLGAAATGTTYDEFRRRALNAVPIKRIIQPEEIAGLVRFLASPGAAAITGQTYNICGGQVMS
jgi:NAD(P)-dependent dehydrogenase (short-subunit alcohol dehydrogenase family)